MDAKIICETFISLLSSGDDILVLFKFFDLPCRVIDLDDEWIYIESNVSTFIGTIYKFKRHNLIVTTDLKLQILGHNIIRHE